MPSVLFTHIPAATLAAAGVTVIGHAFVDHGRGQHLALLLDTTAGTVQLTDNATGELTLSLDQTPTGIDDLARALGVADTSALASALDELLTASIAAFTRRLADHKEAIAADLVTDLAVELTPEARTT